MDCPPGVGLGNWRARGARGLGEAPQLSLSAGYLFSFLVAMTGSQPSSPFPLEGHASQTGPTANLGALGFLFWGNPTGPRAPWGAVAGSAARRAGCGLSRPARGGEAPVAAVLGLCAARMASSNRTRCISRKFWCLGVYRGVCARQLPRRPSMGPRVPETRACEAQGCPGVREAEGASP